MPTQDPLERHATTGPRPNFDDAWEERYAELAMITVQRGRPVPQRASSSALVDWVASQQRIWRAGKLAPERQSRLSALGLRMEPQNEVWDDMLSRLAEFQEKHSQWDAAYIKQFDPKLANWVAVQKTLIRREALSDDRLELLTNMGLSPAREALRGSKAEIDARHHRVLEDLRAYAATWGHLRLPASNNPRSLVRRMGALKKRALRDKDSFYYRELLQLGAFVSYESMEWENQFSAWRRYAVATGDYACVGSPPAGVADWVADLRKMFDALPGDPLALPTRYTVPVVLGQRRIEVGGRVLPKVKFKRLLEIRQFIDRVQNRLLHAGFVVRPASMGEEQVLSAKVARICGLPPSPALSLRVVLRAAGRLMVADRLSDAAEAALVKLGLFWHKRTRCWRRKNLTHHVVGSMTITPVPAPPPKMSVEDVIALLAPQNATEERGNDQALCEALKIVFSAKNAPMTLQELHAIPSVQVLVAAAGYCRHRDERVTLRLTLWSLCQRQCLVPEFVCENSGDFLAFRPGPNPFWVERNRD